MQSEPIEIIRRVKGGDRNAFKIFYNTHAFFVFGIAYRILKDKSMAEEVVQECFVNLWINKEQIEEQKDIRSFIFVIAKRICLNNLRKLNYGHSYLQQVKMNNVNDVEEKINFNELEQALINFIACLPNQQRIAFELSRKEGFTHQQIADKMGISPNTVKNHISKALAELRVYLKSTNYEVPLFLLFFFFLD